MPSPSWFLIEWLNRLEEQYAQNAQYRQEIIRGYAMNNLQAARAVNMMMNNPNEIGLNINSENINVQPVPVVNMINNLNEIELGVNGENINVGVVENPDNISIITVSDDEPPAIITGFDVFLGAVDEQNNVDNDHQINANGIVQVNEIHVQNDFGYESDSNNENVPEPPVNRIRNAAAAAANIIHQIIQNENENDTDSDAETVEFDYEEILRQPPPARRLIVDYSDSESENDDDINDNDSYFEKCEESSGPLEVKPAICPICRETLINKKPYLLGCSKHFLCAECVKGMFKMSMEEWKCPICRFYMSSKYLCKRVYL